VKFDEGVVGQELKRLGLP